MKHPLEGNTGIFNSRWFERFHAGRCALALFVLALLVRLVPLGHYVTPDEPIWVLRSVRLLDAITAGEWASAPQTGHPGFTTMVIGALGVQLTRWLQPAASLEHLSFIRDIAWLAPESSSAFPHLAFFLNTCRVLVALACTSGILLIYSTGKQRLGERTARLLALCLALDPFFAGHAGLLHTDALQATFVILTVLFLLPQGTQQAKFSAITVSAFFLACAGLTKTLGLLIAPGLALVLVLWGSGSFWQRCLRVVMLGLLSLLFMFLLFPPFWSAPLAALQRLIEAVTYHQGAGLRDVFFAGQLHIDPGPFFYPAVLLFRLTAPVLAGLLLGVRQKDRVRHPATKWLLVPIGIYIVALTLATKKFDRYVLSVIPLLTVIACIQWRFYYRRWKMLFLALLCLPWALVALVPLYYANPLLGGPWLAQVVVPFGWGEGSGYAAQKFNKFFAEPQAHTILTGDIPGVASLFEGQVQPKEAAYALCAEGVISREAPDFAGYEAVGDIVIAGMHLTTLFSRTTTFPDGNYLVSGPVAGIEADAVAPRTTTPALGQWLDERFNGLPFTWIHAAGCDPITEAQLAALLCPPDSVDGPCNCTAGGTMEGVRVDQCQFTQLAPAPVDYIVRVGDKLDVVAATWSPVITSPSTLDVYIRWTVQNPYENLVAYLALKDTDGLIWAEGSTILSSQYDWLKSARSPGSLLDGQVHMPLLAALPPGSYIVTLSFSDNNNRGMGLTNPDGTFGGIHTDLGTVTIASNPMIPSEVALPERIDLSLPGYHVRAAMAPPISLFAGDPLPFRLEMARTGSGAPLPESITWTVLCEGNLHSQGALLDVPGDPEAWQVGHYYELRYAPRTDPTSSDADCTLALQSENRTLAQLGAFHIRERERSFSLPKTPQVNLEFQIGSFANLTGADIPQLMVTPNSVLPVTLYWQAQQASDLNYTVFVHLKGQDGRVWAQSDTPPAGGNAPTTTWMPGQVIVDDHMLELSAEVPPGEYTLFAGLYDAISGYRETLYTLDGTRVLSDQIPIGKIMVNE